MSPESPSFPRPTRRTAPWLLAALTIALALAGPAYADSIGAEGTSDIDAVLAAQGVGAPEAPPEPPEPVYEPADAPPAEPVPPEPDPPEADPPEADPLVEAPPEEEPAVPVAAEQAPAPAAVSPASAEPSQPAGPVEEEEEATEPPAYIVDEPGPAPPPEDAEEADEDEADEDAGPIVIPLNLNVDIRILSPGDDGDVSQGIDLGDLASLGSGNPTDVLGGLGLGALDLGLDWTWNWNWTWDCGDGAIAGLDWNWNWTWSGDCAAGMLGEPGDERATPLLMERIRTDRLAGRLEALGPDTAAELQTETGAQPGPLVATPGAGGGRPVKRDERDEAGTLPAKSSPPAAGGGAPVPAPTSFASTGFAPTGAITRPKAAKAPARRPAGSDPNGDPESEPAGLAAQAMGLSAAGGGGGGGGGLVLLLAALIGALALVPPPAGGRIAAVKHKLSSLLSSSRLERPG